MQLVQVGVTQVGVGIRRIARLAAGDPIWILRLRFRGHHDRDAVERQRVVVRIAWRHAVRVTVIVHRANCGDERGEFRIGARLSERSCIVAAGRREARQHDETA